MRKKYNKRIFAFCFALIIIGMLAVNALAVDYDLTKDQLINNVSYPVTVTNTSPIFQIPTEGNLEFEIDTLFPMGALYLPEIMTGMELMYFEEVYALQTAWNDNEGMYSYYWQGYKTKITGELYALAVYDYHVFGEYIEINLGIKRVTDNTWLYSGQYDTNNGYFVYDTPPILWYTPKITIFQGPLTEQQEAAGRLLRLLPVTSLYEEGSYPTDRTSYEMGYQDGLTDATNEGIQIGYNEGKTQGYAIGYTEGYNANENNNPFKNLINAVIFTPIDTVMSMLNFELFGINMKGMVLTLLTAMIVIAIVVIIWKKVT